MVGSVDEDDDWEVKPENIAAIVERFRGRECPLFMDEIPVDFESNPDYEALRGIIYGDHTPTERAASYRVQGNECFADAEKCRNRTGRYRDAIKCYSEGIRQESDDSKLNSLLYSNRAHVQLILGEYSKCCDDCRVAVKLDPGNIKAYYRGAKASYCLELLKQCIEFCTQGLEQDPQNAPLAAVLQKAQIRLAELNISRSSLLAAESQATQSELQRKRKCLQEAYHSRGLSVTDNCSYNTGALQLAETHYLDPDTNTLHWSCLCLFPAEQVSEAILSVDENQCLDAEFQRMFPGNGSFAPWDHSCSYVWDKLSVFLECGGDEAGEDSLIRVPYREASLKKILQHTRYVSAVPVFRIVVANSSAEAALCAESRITPWD